MIENENIIDCSDVKVLLISLNRYTQPYPVFPLGMAYIASALKMCGCVVEVCDCTIDFETIENSIQGFNPDCIGISIRNIDDIRIDNNTYFVPELDRMVKRIRTITDAPLVLGGSAYSLFPETLLELSGADFGVTGEGEIAVQQLVRCLKDNDLSDTRLNSIPALVYRNGKTIVKNKPAILDSSGIPQPFRTSRQLDFYMKNSAIVNIQTQRGCPFKCCYCTYPLIEGCSVRKRSAVDVVDEIGSLVATGGDYFFIVDSVFNIDNNHVASVCEELIQRKITCAWSCFLRPQGLTSDLMALMKKAGLSHIEYGTDSFCDTVLETYGKKFTFDDILHSSELARLHKVHYAHFLIAGGPGETEQTLRLGFENSKQLKKTVIFPFTGMRVFPGTALYDHAIGAGTVTEHDNCLDPVFYIASSLTSAHIRYLHEEFRSLMPNWIIDEATDEVKRVMDGLRRKGIRGPLWEFLAR